jgi:hypothetical protein
MVPARSPSDSRGPRIIAAVQRVEMMVLSAAVLGCVLLLVLRFRRMRALDSPVLQITVGLVPGVLGALYVLTNEVDLIPDRYEARVVIVLVTLVVGLTVVGAVRRFASR